MPYINVNTTRKLTAEEKENIKTELGKSLNVLGKSEQWLMVDFEDGKELWLGGKKLQSGAFIEVKLFGDAGRKKYEEMNKLLTDYFNCHFDIPGNCIYVTFTPVEYWGWNGMMF